jgi:predicted permease
VRNFWFSVRQLTRTPIFTAVAILTLALGTGANTAAYGLINDFLRPLPVPNADRIVIVAAGTPGDDTGFRYRYSFPTLEDYRHETGIFSDVMGFDTRIGGLLIDGTTTRFLFHVVTGNLFTGLQLKPAAGRLFGPGEGEQVGSEHVIVLGYSYWRSRFGANPNVINSVVRLNGTSARIVGVAPEGFVGLFSGLDVDGYVPLSAANVNPEDTDRLIRRREFRGLTMIARLQPGVSPAAAETAVNALAARIGATYPATDGHTIVHIVPEPLARPIPLRFFGSILPVMKLLLLILAGLVLLIACMNVANLLLVRTTVRQRELAVRASLGATRGNLVRLLLAESLALAIAGGICGLVLGQWAIQLLVGSIHLGISVPFHLETPMDWRLFAYALVTAVATGAIVGLLPAIRASQASVTDLLHDGSRGQSGGGRRQRMRSALVIAQVAGSLVLLIMAGLFARNLQQARWIDLGFEPERVLTVQLDPSTVGYTQAHAATFYDDVMRRLSGVPGIESVSTALSVPLGYIFAATPVLAEGTVARADEPPPPVGFNPVSPAYFDTIHLAIDRGRGFTDADTETSTRVTVVNHVFAERFWPGQDPIGKRFSTPNIEGPMWQVVGVAHNSKYIAVFEEPLPYFYVPHTQYSTYLRHVHIRSALPPEVLGPAVTKEIAALDHDMPVAEVKTMRQVIDGGFGFLLFKTGALQATALGIIGVILAVVGVYGVVSYGASQRTRELGIRLALGAAPGHVRRIVLGHGVMLVAIGLAVGFVLTFAATHALAKVLLLVSASDPLTFVGVTAILAAVALIACYLPARRAMRVDPMIALRHE